MKKAWYSGILLFVVVFALVLSPVTAFASQPPPGAEITDIYSPWAEFDVFMASTVYGLGNEGTYSNFRGRLLTEKFMPVYNSLADAFGSSAKTELQPGELVTRGQVVAALYGLLDENATADEAAGYFVDVGLMQGRAQGDYQLDAICTVEEMIVLSVRTYEHAVRVSGGDSKGLFWEVQGANNTVYLLGSIHLGDNAIYPFSGNVMSAFDRSANLVVEADVVALSLEDMVYIQAVQMVDFENGETIADYISEETFELYSTLVESLELPEEVYYLKPWAATMGLTTFFMSGGEQEESSAIGVDMLLLTKAYSTGKNIIELEGISYQFDMMDSFSRELQDKQLLETLMAVLVEPDEADEADEVSGEELQAMFEMLLATIKSGDDDVFGAIMAASRFVDAEDTLMAEYDDIFWTRRNKGMADGIARLLDSETDDGDYFVVVGAGHFFGDDSVIAVLIEMGYDVVRVK